MKLGHRKDFNSAEAEWARNYERSLLPKGTRFPRSGDVYEAIDDIEVRYMTHWFAPFTGGGSGVLKREERIVVKDVPDPQPLGVCADPLNRSEVEARLVPQEDLADKKYGGFSLSISTNDLNSKFRIVAEGPTR